MYKIGWNKHLHLDCKRMINQVIDIDTKFSTMLKHSIQCWSLFVYHRLIITEFFAHNRRVYYCTKTTQIHILIKTTQIRNIKHSTLISPIDDLWCSETNLVVRSVHQNNVLLDLGRKSFLLMHQEFGKVLNCIQRKICIKSNEIVKIGHDLCLIRFVWTERVQLTLLRSLAPYHAESAP